MNHEARTPEEFLASITDPVLRALKEIDYQCLCNPTSYRNVLFGEGGFFDDPMECKRMQEIKTIAESLWTACEHIKPYKEADRRFRFALNHSPRLIPFMEYEQEWVAWQERVLGEPDIAETMRRKAAAGKEDCEFRGT